MGWVCGGWERMGIAFRTNRVSHRGPRGICNPPPLEPRVLTGLLPRRSTHACRSEGAADGGPDKLPWENDPGDLLPRRGSSGWDPWDVRVHPTDPVPISMDSHARIHGEPGEEGTISHLGRYPFRRMNNNNVATATSYGRGNEGN